MARKRSSRINSNTQTRSVYLRVHTRYKSRSILQDQYNSTVYNTSSTRDLIVDKMTNTNNFELLSSHKIVGFPGGNIISWCSQMDLLAVSMNLTSLWMFRLDGERVYSINNRTKILHLKWSASGKFFVLSGTDNSIRVYDSNNGKLVNQFSTSAKLPISLVSWTSIDVPFSIAPDGKPMPFQDLMQTDLLAGMPKLSNELDSNSTADVSENPSSFNEPYTSSSVTDTTENDSAMDLLLVVNGDKEVSVTFNNLYTVSEIKLPHSDFNFLQHGIKRDFFEQSFLTCDAASQLYLQDLHIDVTGPRQRGYLFDTIRYASQITSIINHILDQFSTLQKEAKDFFSLYDRYLSNYKDTLYADVDLMTTFPSQDEVEDKITFSLGDMLLTGVVPVSCKDFWLNQFGERGLIRLSSAGNNVYDRVRKLIYTQVILGSEKLIIILSYMEGLAKTADLLKEDNNGIVLATVETAITLVKELVKKIYAFTWKLNDEHEAFNQFLNWLKVEVIERLSKEDNDAEAFAAEHPTLDFKVSSIMEYCADSLFDSVLVQELDLDCSSHETIKKFDLSESSLGDEIAKLHDQLRLSLKEIEESFASKIIFQPALPLDTSSQGSQSHLKLCETHKMITSMEEKTLYVVEAKESLCKMSILFPGQIISHKLFGTNQLLVLLKVKGDVFRMVLVELEIAEKTITLDDMQIRKSFKFSPETAVKRPAFMIVNESRDNCDAMVLVMDVSKKNYSIFCV